MSDAAKPPTFYLNIHTADLKAGHDFYSSLGFIPNLEYSDEKSKTFRLPAPNESICLMVHAHDRFKEFIRPGTQISDAKKVTESLFTFSVDDKEAVDNWLSKAVEAGGVADPYTIPNYGEGYGMYTRSFSDLDGHIWEVITMFDNGSRGNVES